MALAANASFHAIDPEVRELAALRLGVTHSAPSPCAFNPILEFIAYCSARVMQKYGELTSGRRRRSTAVQGCSLASPSGARCE